jgi:signal transduction histidine kinase
MAFQLMLVSRNQYYAKIQQRREDRIRARSISLRWQNKEISRLLDEQRRLLETLTHEVRQPINNAQAALQGIMSELQPARSIQERTLPVAIRIQGILDDITLSLSNAIVGATLVERGEGVSLRDCEITGIAQLALLDCPASARDRIVFEAPPHDIFLAVDPILLRLALRNLLDNAVKFSLPGTEIIFSIGMDEARFGVLMSVTNAISEGVTFERDLVGRGKRGPNAVAKEGSGIGLYVVNEVARIHGQEMVMEISNPGRITFGILLSE